MCGKKSAAFKGAELSLTAGVVVIKKSRRSLYRPRRPTTDMDAGLDRRRTPWKGNCSEPSPGISFRNAALFPLAGTLMVPSSPVDDPSSLASSSVTVAVFEEVFVTARPV